MTDWQPKGPDRTPEMVAALLLIIVAILAYAAWRPSYDAAVRDRERQLREQR